MLKQRKTLPADVSHIEWLEVKSIYHLSIIYQQCYLLYLLHVALQISEFWDPRKNTCQNYFFILLYFFYCALLTGCLFVRFHSIKKMFDKRQRPFLTINIYLSYSKIVPFWCLHFYTHHHCDGIQFIIDHESLSLRLKQV